MIKLKAITCQKCDLIWTVFSDIQPKASACPRCNNVYGIDWSTYEGTQKARPYHEPAAAPKKQRTVYVTLEQHEQEPNRAMFDQSDDFTNANLGWD